ncbi:beta strand repeat-containing protein [Luteolibacter soli]|uniref:Autotransporter-associated beta strand repeat-containing protein n=1 Tax=Luteolibacter soli TaxID=3135280 RepID=A0ABU9B272_9BACT
MLHTALTATTVDFGGQTLRLAADGELISGTGSSVVTFQNGSLTAGGAADTPGTIFLANAGANAPVVTAKITDNGSGAVSLKTAGNVTIGNTVAASTNNFSGGTTVTGGTLTVASPITAGAKSGLGTGPVTVNQGGNLRILTASTANAQSYANNINLNDATLTSEDGVVTYGGTITLSGTNTINAYYADNKSALFTNPSNSITGTGNLVATGTSIVLSGVNTYTGTTRAATGNLQFDKRVSFYNDTPASWTAANLIVNNAATATFAVGGAGEFTAADLDAFKLLGTTTGGFLRGSNLGISTTNAGGSFTYASAIANPNNGINTLGVAKRGTGTLLLSGANTYTGTTSVFQGVVDISGSQSAGGALAIGGGTTLRIIGTGILGGGTHTAAIANAGTFQHASSSNQTFSGVISGAGAFLKDTSNSTVTFTNNNTYTGATTVNAGTLTLSAQHRTSSGFNVGPGATLSTTTNNIFTVDHGTAMDNARLFTVNGGTLLFPNSGDNRIGNVTLRNGATWTSNRTLAAWDYLLANTSTGPATVKVENTGGSTLPSVMNGTGGIHLQGVQNFDVANVTVSSATDLTVSMILGAQGNIGGAVGGINKTGTGTMTLAATNTYTGATTVVVGTLLVNGSTNALSATSVSTDATLGGTGTVNGTVTVAAGGIIAPGANTVGTLTTGAATIDGIYACEINGATADKLAVTGNLDIDGASLNVTVLSAPTQPEYILATYTGTRTGTFTGLAEGATVTPGYTITYATAGQIKLVTAPSGPSYTSWASTFTPNPGAAGVDFETTASRTAPSSSSAARRSAARTIRRSTPSPRTAMMSALTRS